LLTILFSELQNGQENRITYPDLVPLISGFTECLIIDILDLVFPRANRPIFSMRYGQSYKSRFLKRWGMRSPAHSSREIPGAKPCMIGILFAVQAYRLMGLKNRNFLIFIGFKDLPS